MRERPRETTQQESGQASQTKAGLSGAKNCAEGACADTCSPVSQHPVTSESLGLEGQRVSQTVVLYLRQRAGSALPGGRALPPSEPQWPGLSCKGVHGVGGCFLTGETGESVTI